MPPSNAMENDKKRLRNQFTKDERTRLLAIMTKYGPLLDDKNISISSRKEIWEIIENKFNENGHSGRTSAQLKKYWQNYKYHSKRTKTIHKEVRKPLSPMAKHMVRMLAKVEPEEWAQCDFAISTVRKKRSHTSQESSPTSTSSIRKRDRQSAEGSSSMSKTCTTPPEGSSKSVVDASLVSDSRPKSEESNARSMVGGNGKISESNVIVSTTDVPGSSVMVSVICPEIPSKGRTVFWKPDIVTEKIRPKLEQIYASAKLDDRAVAERKPMNKLSPDVGNSGMCDVLTGGPMNDSRSGKLLSSISDRSARKMSEPEKSSKRLVRKSTKGQTEVTASQEYRSGRIRNVGGVVEEKRGGSAWLSKNRDPMDTSVSVSMADGRDVTTEARTGDGVPNPSANSKRTPRENRRFVKSIGAGKGNMVDDPEFIGVLENLSIQRESFKHTGILNGIKEMTEVFSKFGDYCNFEEDCVEGFDEDRGGDLTRLMMNRRENFSLQDLSCFEHYLRLLRDVGQLEGSRNNEILRKMQPPVSTLSSTDTGKGNDGASSDSERGMEVDECTAGGSRAAANLRVRRGWLMTPDADEDQAQREIKVEKEVEPETSGTDLNAASAPNTPNDHPEDDGVMNTINYLVQAKLQSAKAESDHQLKLQTLEMEEKELRVKIAEMAIQETRLRIRALVEDRQRATEIHELRLAQMAAEKARFEAEHGSHVDASCTAAAKGRSRISSIERDRERSENIYQMELRCMTAGAGASGNLTANGGTCKPCQQ